MSELSHASLDPADGGLTCKRLPPSYLVCPPRYYDTHFLFNPWMTYRERVNKHRAWRQWRDLVRALESAGAQIETIEPVPDSAAMVFTADAALVLEQKNVLLLANDGPRGELEPPLFRSWFQSNGYAIESMPSARRLDGGNLVRLHDGSLAVGLKPGAIGRSEAYLAKRLKMTSSTAAVVPIALIQKHFLHLDMVIGNVGGKAYLVYPEALASGLEGIENTRLLEKEVIPLDRNDAEAYAANLVAVGDVVITGKISEELRRRISSHGFWVEELPLTEFYKAGGGAKCLTLPL
jgi:N-dimethylarginine dimethylaminohydrolase